MLFSALSLKVLVGIGALVGVSVLSRNYIIKNKNTPENTYISESAVEDLVVQDKPESIQNSPDLLTMIVEKTDEEIELERQIKSSQRMQIIRKDEMKKSQDAVKSAQLGLDEATTAWNEIAKIMWRNEQHKIRKDHAWDNYESSKNNLDVKKEEARVAQNAFKEGESYLKEKHKDLEELQSAQLALKPI